MTTKRAPFIPTVEQMQYDLVDLHLHMMPLYEIMSMAREHLNKEYRGKTDDSIQAEWISTFHSVSDDIQ